MDFLSDMIGSLIELFICSIPVLLSIGVIWLFFRSSKKLSKTKQYRNFSFALTIFGCVCLLVAGTQYLSNSISKDSSGPSNAADGFTIEQYKVKLNVNQNNIVDVTEIITVNFYESGHHGIYRFIPEWLEYTGKNGETISRKSNVLNLKAEDEEYSIETIDGKDRIKIGSANKTLTEGLKTYMITYHYDMGEDPFSGFDEFIFHAFGDYWGTQINGASLEITMPKPIEENSITFFSDKHRKRDITSYVDYYIDGNTLYANLSPSYNLNSALTIDMELPEGYFIGARNTYGYSTLTACFLVIIFAIIAFIKWIKYGRDYGRYLENAQCYPPEGYDSASIGYIYKQDGGRKLTISTLLELASKGFIKIDESKEDHVITITNLYPNGSYHNESREMTSNEQIVYDQLFANGDVNVLAQDKNFYTVFERITTNLQSELDDKINDTNSYKNMAITSVLFILGVVYFLFSFFILEDLNPKFNMIYPITLIAFIVMVILIILMKRKNTYGEQMIVKIDGFKNFLETAPETQLNALVHNTPNYFYDILPYAYVLGISKTWIEKFGNIPIPQINIGSFDCTTVDSFNILLDSIHYPSSSSSSSSGCSSCGGGCSSCGGGGSW